MLDNIGSDIRGTDTLPRASSPGECQDTASNPNRYRMYHEENWRFNRFTTPNELTVSATEDALREAGTNVGTVNNKCGVGNGVPFGMSFQGDSDRGTGIDAHANCVEADGLSVVGFGDLPRYPDLIIRGKACQSFALRLDANDELLESDVRLNKVDPRWTTTSTAGSCSNKYGVEPVTTHERGQTFGLGHVDEATHANLTMSELTNGMWQASENTLGRGTTWA